MRANGMLKDRNDFERFRGGRVQSCIRKEIMVENLDTFSERETPFSRKFYLENNDGFVSYHYGYFSFQSIDPDHRWNCRVFGGQKPAQEQESCASRYKATSRTKR